MSDIDTFDTGFGVIDKLPTADMLRPASDLAYRLHDNIKEAIYNPINDAQQAYAVYQAKIQQAIADQLAQAATTVDGIHEVITNDISTKLNTSAETVAGYVSKYDGGSNQPTSYANQALASQVAESQATQAGIGTNPGQYYVYQPRCPTNRTCYLLLIGEPPQDQSDYPHGPYPSFDDAYTALIGLCGLQATGCANGSNGQLTYCVWRCNNGVGGYFYEVQPSDQDLSAIQGCTRLSCWPTQADADVEKARLEGTSGGGGNGGGNGDGGGGGGGNGGSAGDGEITQEMIDSWCASPIDLASVWPGGPYTLDVARKVAALIGAHPIDTDYKTLSTLYPNGWWNFWWSGGFGCGPIRYDDPQNQAYTADINHHLLGYFGSYNKAIEIAYKLNCIQCDQPPPDKKDEHQPPPPPCGTPIFICNWPDRITKELPPPPNGQPKPREKETPFKDPAGDKPDTLDGDFWNPCDPNWCQSLEQDLDGFASFSTWFKSWFNSVTDPSNITVARLVTGSVIVDAIADLLTGLAGKLIEHIATKIVKNINDVLEQIVPTIADCNKDAFFGLVAARAILTIFSESILGLNFVIEGYLRVHIDFRNYVERIDHLMNYLCPSRIPSEGNIIRMYLRDEIDREHAKCLLRLHGLDPGCSEILLDAEREIVDWREVYRYAKMADKDQTWIDRKVGTIGFKDDSDKEILKTLYEEIPGIHDILHFAQVNEDDKDVKARFKLDDEFERFWKDDYKRWLTIQGVKEETGKHYWRAHWVRATVEQAQAALRRLRPGRVKEAIEFTDKDFEAVMRENDILPFWRERFKYLGYNPISIRFIQRIYAFGVVDKDEVIKLLQDINYRDTDAQKIADALEIQNKRTLATTGRGWTVPAVASAYKQGLMTASEVTNILKDQGYTDGQISALVDRVERELRIDLQRKVITDAHKCYVGGYTDERETRYVMSSIQVSPDRINDYIALWNVEISCKSKLVTASQLQNYAKKGLISRDELISRLERLGYDDDSISLLLAAVDDAIRDILAKQMDVKAKLADKTAKEAQKQAEKAAKQAEAEAAKLLKQAQKCAHKGIKAKLLRDRAKLLASMVPDPVKGKQIIDKAELEAQTVEADAAVEGCLPLGPAST